MDIRGSCELYCLKSMFFSTFFKETIWSSKGIKNMKFFYSIIFFWKKPELVTFKRLYEYLHYFAFLLIRRKVSSFPSSGHFANLIIFLKADYCTNLPNSSHFFFLFFLICRAEIQLLYSFCRSKLVSYKNPLILKYYQIYKMNVY